MRVIFEGLGRRLMRSASTNEHKMMSFLMSETPLSVTRLVLPPASVLMIILACSPIHFPHATCIFCSSACRIVGSVFAQSAITELGMRYRTRNFSLVALSWLFPSAWRAGLKTLLRTKEPSAYRHRPKVFCRKSVRDHNGTPGRIYLEPRYFRYGSWLCENAKTLNRDRRTYSSKTVLVAQRASGLDLETELKNIILRRVSIFEFLHGQGQK